MAVLAVPLWALPVTDRPTVVALNAPPDRLSLSARGNWPRFAFTVATGFSFHHSQVGAFGQFGSDRNVANVCSAFATNVMAPMHAFFQ